jgi:hypothetical protein
MGDVEITWTRDTPWRQGHLLSREAFNQLELQKLNSSTDACAVVISHDCDLANPNLEDEPDVEIIVGSFVAKLDGNYAHAKTPRTLHLEVQIGSAEKIIELIAIKKTTIAKKLLAKFSPDKNHLLANVALSALRSWLSIRYNRAAFPDSFVDRFNQVKEKFNKLIKPSEKTLLSVYFDLDRGEIVQRVDGSPYQLSIILVYYAKDDPFDASETISALVKKIEDLFEEKYFIEKAEAWNSIELKSCISISDEAITISQARQLQQWHLEHMTLKAEASK